ncbi:MAG TPA: hypothetical protein VE776_07640 [Actinomycetota bacterium]|nr:hypothetical protein [Actinomycetota bacterium]
MSDLARFRRPRLPPLGRPRRLSPPEVEAIKARPWPRLPWWLWLAVIATTVAMVAVAVLLLTQGGGEPVGVGGRRPPPAGGLTHGVGAYRVPALEPPNAARVVRRRATCPRLSDLTLVGTPGEVTLLSRAADLTCALRSTPGIERARTALNRPGVQVAFAEFQVSTVESTTRLRPVPPTVLVTGTFSERTAQRVATVLIHEGTHLAAGRPPTAADELAADQAELDACQRLFPPSGGITANQDCRDAAELLSSSDAAALQALRAAGYR